MHPYNIPPEDFDTAAPAKPPSDPRQWSHHASICKRLSRCYPGAMLC
jgi:hypothetical protein